MAAKYDFKTYHVTYLDDLFGLKTLTFNNKESANDFCNSLILENCKFIHFYEAATSTIYYNDESSVYVF